MSLIFETASEMNQAYISTNNFISRANLFLEASWAEFEINQKEAALKVLKENGTDEDYEFLCNEAAGDYIERAKKTLERIVESVKKFIMALIDKVQTLYTSAKLKIAMDRADTALRKNSVLASVKVTYTDTSKSQNILERGFGSVKSKFMKLISKSDRNQDKEFENIMREAELILDKAKMSVRQMEIKLSDAVGKFKKFNINDLKDNRIEVVVNVSTSKSVHGASITSRITAIINKLAEIIKEKARMISTTFISIGNTIKSVFTKKATVTESADENESFDIESLEMFNYAESGYDDEFDMESVEENGFDLDSFLGEMEDLT